MTIRVGVLTISDGCARGEREDVSGRVMIETLAGQAQSYEIAARGVTPDDPQAITTTLLAWCATGCDLILTTGGTGFSPRDVTPEATRAVIEREAPGLAELLRWTGYQKLPRAVLSRGVAGIHGTTLIVNLPGSTGGVRDGLEVLLPLISHAIALLREEPVDHTPGVGYRVSGVGNGVEKPGGGGQGAGGRNTERVPDEGNERHHEGKDQPVAAVSDTRHPTPDTRSISTDVPPQSVVALEANLDDFSPEFYETLMERLFAAGAVDVFLTPIQMKKQRPAMLLTALAPPERRDTLADVIFSETTTLGLRHTTLERITLERRWESVETPYGPIRVKIGQWRGADTTASPEYEDVKAAALANGVPVKTVYFAAQQAYAQK